MNDDVIAFIRKANRFAHSDVSSVLIDVCKEMTGCHFYCPSYGSMAYLALSTESNRIFAIAYNQHALSLRLPDALHADTTADGGVPETLIGPEWIRFNPFEYGRLRWQERLSRWFAEAFSHAS